jgi:hypothetical protein
MNKRLATIAAVILLVLIPAFSTAWAASWVKQLVLDSGLSSQTREDYHLAIDMVDILFTKYKIVLSNPVTIVVTAEDDESYIRALMSYANLSRAGAEKRVRGRGVSLNTKSLIIIRHLPTRAKQEDYDYIQKNRGATLQTLPHELFHQVWYQNYSHAHPVNWLQEGPADLFAYMACETAGTGVTVTVSIARSFENIRRAPKIPDTRQLATYDYKDWESLGPEYHETGYDMAMCMTYLLVGVKGFEKVLLYYQLLDNGSDPDTAFNNAFGAPMSKFLTYANDYFDKCRH